MTNRLTLTDSPAAANIVFLKAGQCNFEVAESHLGNFVLRRKFSGENPSLQKYKTRWPQLEITTP